MQARAVGGASRVILSPPLCVLSVVVRPAEELTVSSSREEDGVARARGAALWPPSHPRPSFVGVDPVGPRVRRLHYGVVQCSRSKRVGDSARLSRTPAASLGASSVVVDGPEVLFVRARCPTFNHIMRCCVKAAMRLCQPMHVTGPILC